MKRVIGLDFDNTIICYDNLMHKIALERGLIQKESLRNKKYIRDSIRELSDGEMHWQRLQASVYGQRIMEAEPFPGVDEFLKLCKIEGVEVYIVSHKTEYASQDDTGTNLRDASLRWMSDRRVAGSGLAIGPEKIFFESERDEKCKRIEKVGCTHFVDDLEEVFCDDAFPEGVQKILYDPHTNSPHLTGITAVSSWDEIGRMLF